MLICGCCSFKVLLVPISAGSHVISFQYIAQRLLDRGHEVHMLLHVGYKLRSEWTQKDEITYHKFGSTDFSFDKGSAKMGIDLMHDNYSYNIDQILKETLKFTKIYTNEFCIGNEEIMDHLDSLKFDAVVIDHVFFMKIPVAIAKRFRVPLISYVDFIDPWLVRMPWFPSIHSSFVLETDSKSTFYSRLFNTIILLKSKIFSMFPDPDNSILEFYRKYEHFEDLDDIIRTSVLFLITDDPLLNVVRPYTANVISIGGLTTDAWKKGSPLPNDFMRFIEEGESLGIVVASFGSMIPKYPEHLAKLFLEASSKLPQYTFFWRFENYLNLSIPKNVKVVDWLPQQELLSHKSVKLFITHSGNNGQFEALYHGVPMLAVPLMGDQMRNSRRIVERGYGEEIDFRTLKINQLVDVINKIIEDPSYKERIMKASEIFKSRPDSPAERAAFWIEHVIKFGGDHLKPAGNDLYFWQYLCLDVLLFLQAVVVVGILFVAYVLIKIIGLLKRIFLKNVDSSLKVKKYK